MARFFTPLRFLSRLEPATRRALLGGLLVRLLVMPFTAHSDLLYAYWNAHLIAYHGKLASLQVLLQYLHALWLRLVGPLLPPVDTLWAHLSGGLFLNPFVGQVVSTQGWLDFIGAAGVYRTLFLLKVPYLLFDLGCAFLLYRLGSDALHSRRLFRFWWLNPILIFAVYVFGRHEVIALFFVILSIYWIKREKHVAGMLALGVAIAVRYYAILLLPFFVLSLPINWRRRLGAAAAGLAPWLVVNLAGWALSGTVEAAGIAGLPHDSYLLAARLPVAAWDNIYIFPLAYLLLLLHRLYSRETGLDSLVNYSLAALLLLFATAYTGQSPHYWTWFLPLLTISAARDRRLVPLHAAQIVFLAGYSLIGGRSPAGYLLAPISPEFFWSLPAPIEVLGRWASPETLISLARTAFSAVTLWMAYLILPRAGRPAPPGEEVAP